MSEWQVVARWLDVAMNQWELREKEVEDGEHRKVQLRQELPYTDGWAVVAESSAKTSIGIEQ